MVYGVAAVLIVVAAVLGFRYGKKLESDAFAELSKIKASFAKAGQSVDAYVSGDINKIRAEAAKVLGLASGGALPANSPAGVGAAKS